MQVLVVSGLEGSSDAHARTCTCTQIDCEPHDCSAIVTAAPGAADASTTAATTAAATATTELLNLPHACEGKGAHRHAPARSIAQCACRTAWERGVMAIRIGARANGKAGLVAAPMEANASLARVIGTPLDCVAC